MSDAVPERESLLTFPCVFPIKVMGRREDGFAQTVAGIVQRHAPDFHPHTMEMRPSKNGRYLSVTCPSTRHPGSSWTRSIPSCRSTP